METVQALLRNEILTAYNVQTSRDVSKQSDHWPTIDINPNLWYYFAKIPRGRDTSATRRDQN